MMRPEHSPTSALNGSSSCHSTQKATATICLLPPPVRPSALLPPQIDPGTSDDGSGELANERLWHQQALVTGQEHTPLDAAAAAAAKGGTLDEAAVKVRAATYLQLQFWSQLQ